MNTIEKRLLEIHGELLAIRAKLTEINTKEDELVKIAENGFANPLIVMGHILVFQMERDVLLDKVNELWVENEALGILDELNIPLSS